RVIGIPRPLAHPPAMDCRPFRALVVQALLPGCARREVEPPSIEFCFEPQERLHPRELALALRAPGFRPDDPARIHHNFVAILPRIHHMVDVTRRRIEPSNVLSTAVTRNDPEAAGQLRKIR